MDNEADIGATMIVGLTAFPLLVLLLQSPGSGWIAAQALPREVRRLYSELIPTNQHALGAFAERVGLRGQFGTGTRR